MKSEKVCLVDLKEKKLCSLDVSISTIHCIQQKDTLGKKKLQMKNLYC